jgi:hypothetical protein
MRETTIIATITGHLGSEYGVSNMVAPQAEARMKTYLQYVLDMQPSHEEKVSLTPFTEFPMPPGDGVWRPYRMAMLAVCTAVRRIECVDRGLCSGERKRRTGKVTCKAQ